MIPLESFIDAIDQLMIAQESIHPNETISRSAILSTFMSNPKEYLHDLNRYKDDECSDVEVLRTDGSMFANMEYACKKLISVNAYQSAIAIYDRMIEILEQLKMDVPDEDAETLEYSIDRIRNSIISTIELRETYESKRKQVLSEFDGILRRL